LEFPSIEITDSLFEVLAEKLLEGGLMTSLGMPDLILTVLGSLNDASNPTNDRKTWSVAQAIARTNRVRKSSSVVC